MVFWKKEDYDCAVAGRPKGETDGNAVTVKQKKSVGRPRKSSEKPRETAHVYLEREDGTPVSEADLKLLSQKARSHWETLHERKYAPRTWGGISGVAWEFYCRSMLSERGLSFLRLCDDAQWKLREWTKLNYSGWSGRNGIREVQPRKKDEKIENPIDNKDLFQMETEEDENATEETLSDDQSHTANDQNQGADTSDRERTTAETEASNVSIDEYTDILICFLGRNSTVSIGRGQPLVTISLYPLLSDADQCTQI